LVSAVKHPSARVPAALNQDAMSNTDNLVLDHIVELFLPTQCGVCSEPLPEDTAVTAYHPKRDQRVYALYGQRPEEIKIVEEASA
jgi:hypothetical protein